MKSIHINTIFIIFISLAAFFMPSLPVGVDLDVSQVLLWVFFFFYLFYTPYFTSLHKRFWILPAVLVGFLVTLPFVDKGALVVHAEKAIPQAWFDIYHSSIDNFYHPKSRGYFQLIHLLEYFLIFQITCKIGSSAGENNYVATFNKSFFILLCSQTMIAVLQVLSGEPRAYGTLGNAQAIGCICITIFVFKTFNKWKYVDFLFYVPLLVLSDTRSSLATVVLITLISLFSYRKIVAITYATVVFVFMFSVVLLANEEMKDMIIAVAFGVFGNTSTLTQRYLLWESSFLDIVRASPLFGTYGRVPRFPDNIFWFLIVPWGGVGLFAYLKFFYNVTRLQDKRLPLMIFAFFFQGFTYYGYMNGTTAYIWWGVLGYIAGETIKSKSVCGSFLLEKNS